MLLGNKISRNLGLDPNDILKASILKNKVQPKLIILKIQTERKIILIPGFETKDKDILEGFLSVEALQSCVNAKTEGFSSFIDDKIDFESIQLQKENIDVTNLHSILVSNGVKFHHKVFSNLKNSKKELDVTSILSKSGLYPKVRGYLSYQNDPYIIIWDRIEKARNCDDYLGELYSKMMNKELTWAEGKNVITLLYDEIGQVLANFWKEINGKVDFDKESSFSWVTKFNQDLDTIQSNVPDFSLENKDNVLKWFATYNSSLIHGDAWLRQFLKSESGIILVDLEDVKYGPLGYDVGGLVNSILQQGAYFELEYPFRSQLPVMPIKFTSEYIKVLIATLQPSWYVGDWEKEVIIGRIIRAIHELSYLVKHQPNLGWLIDFILDMIKSLDILLT